MHRTAIAGASGYSRLEPLRIAPAGVLFAAGTNVAESALPRGLRSSEGAGLAARSTHRNWVQRGVGREFEAVSEQVKERVELARRCAWCERVFVNDEWIRGRRADDEAVQPAATHTICDECTDRLRQDGVSI